MGSVCSDLLCLCLQLTEYWVVTLEKVILSHQKILHCVNTSILKRKLGTAVRKKQKQWLLYLNDAVSIFQWWQGGQTSGIIVTRATGCPEEEVRAESCTRAFRARGVDGWEAFTSFPPLCRRPRGSPFSAGLPLQPRMPWPCCTRP